jgi:hypothetical protein
MSIDKKIIQEIQKYHRINKYITEQEVPPPPGGDVPPPPGGDVPPPPDAGVPPPPGGDVPPPPGAPAPGAAPEGQVVDPTQDPDVEKIGDEDKKDKGEEGTEELEITDLVTSQKNIEEKQEEYFQNLFSQLSNLESKLKEMDSVITKLNDIETKIEKYRNKTPEEKLELRSLDSGPYNQKLSDFFTDKEPEMEKSGKNEYILTTDDVENYQPTEIRQSFNVIDPDAAAMRVKR